jgi:hypothetical protein
MNGSADRTTRRNEFHGDWSYLEIDHMSFVTGNKNGFSVKAYVGDKKTLLAFNFQTSDNAKKSCGLHSLLPAACTSARLLFAKRSPV